MKALAAGVLCACLFLSGCSRSKVNEVSVFEYEASDGVLMMSLKTSGNLVPWVVGAVCLSLAAAPALALEALAAYADSR